jgi:hypothetical protein
MKIWTKIEWAIIGAAVALLLLLLILFGYSHPHSDDFSYNYFLSAKGYVDASYFVFQQSGGRFFSTILIFLSPLKSHSIIGYQWLTAILFLSFVASLYAFLALLFASYVPYKSRIFLFAFLFLGFFSFVPDLHELIYWLCAEATYLSAATLWLWSIVFHVLLAKKSYQNKWWLWLLCAFTTIALVGCSEVGIILNIIPVSIHFIYRRQMGLLSHKGFWFVTLIYLLASIFIVFSAGNLHRHDLTPFSGNIVLAISGGLYAAGLWLSQWALIFIPLVCFYILIFGHRLIGWVSAISQFKFLKARTVFLGSLIFFILAQILVVWMTGSTPEPRFENVLFLFLFLSFLLSAQLMMYEQAELFDILKGRLHRGFKTLSFIYLMCVFLVVPNNAVSAFFDVFSGNARDFDIQTESRDELIKTLPDSIIAVPRVEAKPILLYYPTFSCQKKLDLNDIPRMGAADYFGKKWIYEYPCNSEKTTYSIKEFLKQKREQFFSKEQK